MSAEYPHLRHLLQAYFHQDWDLDDPNSEAVLERYMAHELPHRVSATRTDLKNFLATTSDAEIDHKVIEELGTDYPGATAAESLRTWLERVLEQLEGAPTDGA